MAITQAELERHTEALWQLCFEYVKANDLETTTAGILIVRELLPADKNAQPNVCVQYAGDPRQAAVTMARCAAAELQRAGVKVSG